MVPVVVALREGTKAGSDCGHAALKISKRRCELDRSAQTSWGRFHIQLLLNHLQGKANGACRKRRDSLHQPKLPFLGPRLDRTKLKVIGSHMRVSQRCLRACKVRGLQRLRISESRDLAVIAVNIDGAVQLIDAIP